MGDTSPRRTAPVTLQHTFPIGNVVHILRIEYDYWKQRTDSSVYLTFRPQGNLLPALISSGARSPAPVHERSPAPVHKRSPAPVQERSGSLSSQVTSDGQRIISHFT